jgi:hypothetical protein
MKQISSLEADRRGIWLRNPLPFMENGNSPFPQESIAGPYAEPDESDQYPLRRLKFDPGQFV